MDCAFQLSYEDILKILSSVFFGDGKSREACNKLLPKRLTVFVNPQPLPAGLLQGENNLKPLILKYWRLYQTRERFRCCSC